MKNINCNFLVLIICLCILSCSKSDEITILNQEQSNKILLSYVQFDDNQYIINLDENDVRSLNIDAQFYNEFTDLMNSANEEIRKAISEGVEIVFARKSEFQQNTNDESMEKYLSRSFEDYVQISSSDSIFSGVKNYRSVNYCNKLGVSASSNSPFWGLMISATGRSVMLIGDENTLLPVDDYIEVNGLMPISWNIEVAKRYGSLPIRYSLVCSNTLQVALIENDWYKLPSGFKISYEKTGAGKLNLILDNNTGIPYYYKLYENPGGVPVQSGIYAGARVQFVLSARNYSFELYDYNIYWEKISNVSILMY